MKYSNAWEQLKMQVADAYNTANQHMQSSSGEQRAVFKAERRAYQDVLDMIEELEGEWE